MPYNHQNDTESESKKKHRVELPPSYQPPYLPIYEEEEIDLLDYWHMLMKWKRMILFLVCVALVGSVIASLLMPDIYRTEVSLASVEEKESDVGIGRLLGQFSGLAPMVGISLRGSTNEVNLAVLKSRAFIKKIVQDNHLMPLLFPDKWDSKKNAWIETDPEKQPTLWDAYRLLNKILTVLTDRKTGLTTVALEREDPEQAASWLTLFIETLDTHLKEQAIKEAEANIAYLTEQIEETPLLEMRQTLYGVIAEQTRRIMLAKAQRYFAFKVIDPPEVPDRKYKPKRSMIVILSTLIAIFMSIFLAFFLEYIKRQKDEATESKVR